MIPTIETICVDLKAGKITVQQAIAWLHQHAEGSANELRDMFAAAALQGLCANAHINPDVQYGPMAYKLADDMLRNRSRGDTNEPR